MFLNSEGEKTLFSDIMELMRRSFFRFRTLAFIAGTILLTLQQHPLLLFGASACLVLSLGLLLTGSERDHTIVSVLELALLYTASVFLYRHGVVTFGFFIILSLTEIFRSLLLMRFTREVRLMDGLPMRLHLAAICIGSAYMASVSTEGISMPVTLLTALGAIQVILLTAIIASIVQIVRILRKKKHEESGELIHIVEILIILISLTIGTGFSSPFLRSLPTTTDSYSLSLEARKPIAQVDERYLSVALDVSHLLGGKWWGKGYGWNPTVGAEKIEPFDISQERLAKLASHLTPAYLRIGGTEADKVYYAMDNEAGDPPRPYTLSLTTERTDEILDFTKSAGFDLMFTLNAGPGPRDTQKHWTPENANQLIAYVKSKGFTNVIWELGNEVNGFLFSHGLSLPLSQYVRDTYTLKNAIGSSPLAAFSSLIFPTVGEPYHFLDTQAADQAGDLLTEAPIDIVTWHYYPQQSRRCWIITQPAHSHAILHSEILNESGFWADRVNAWAEYYLPHAQVWLGETGPALCGGEPGFSDTYLASLWWLDHLGQMAVHNQQVLIRQSLTGGDYGLIDDETLDPTPGYWTSYFWKKFMGTRVLGIDAVQQQPTPEGPTLRAYAHCTANQKNTATLVLINTHWSRPAHVSLPGTNTPSSLALLTSNEALSSEITMNGILLEDLDGEIPALNLIPYEGHEITLPPLSAVFIILPISEQSACK